MREKNVYLKGATMSYHQNHVTYYLQHSWLMLLR